MIKRQALLVGALALLSVVGVAADAHAGISNPGTFDFDIPSGQDSRFRFYSGGPTWTIDDGGAGFIETDVDSVGGMTNFAADTGTGSFVSGGVTMTSQLVFQGTTSGIANVTTGTFEFDLSLKVRLTYAGSACNTSAFAVTLSTSNWSGFCTSAGTYDETTGNFCAYASGFTVPQLAAAACGGHGNALNSYFNLGSSTGTEMAIHLGNVSPIMHD